MLQRSVDKLSAGGRTGVPIAAGGFVGMCGGGGAKALFAAVWVCLASSFAALSFALMLALAGALIGAAIAVFLGAALICLALAVFGEAGRAALYPPPLAAEKPEGGR